MSAVPSIDTTRGPSRRRSRGQAAGASLVACLLAAGLPIVAGGAPVRAQLLLAIPGVIALVGALLGWTPGFTIAAISLGTEYALRLGSRHRLDGLAVVEAVVLFAAVEIGLRSLDARTVALPERHVRQAAAWRLIAMLSGAAVSSSVVLALGTRRLPAPTAGLALGLAAAATVLVAAELLRRRATSSAQDH
jgi:hypothetical protein